MTGKTLATGKVLVVDDEEIVRESLLGWLQEDGLDVTACESGEDALEVIAKDTFDLMLVDLKMPGMDGIQLLQKARAIQPQTPVLIMTAYGTIDTAVQAMRSGAYDYITKPFNPEEISMTIQKILHNQRLLRENIQLRLHIANLYDYHTIKSNNQQMRKILELILSISDSRSPVLIQGEDGTGRRLMAKVIHFNSSRAAEQFVAVSCRSLPERALERELFGQEKESAIDSESARRGALERTGGGTLFLDEVGALSSRLQAKLLRTLQEKEFMRIGGGAYIPLDVRLIAATTRDIWKGAQEGWFREDLYYRLNVIPLALPPLRERKEDIPLLVEHFISTYNILDDRTVKGVNQEAISYLMNYHWPGNVRELETVVERAMLITTTGVITPADLPPYLTRGEDADISSIESLSLEDIERRYIGRILQKNNWNIKKTAELLKIDRTTLYDKVKKYKLNPESISEES